MNIKKTISTITFALLVFLFPFTVAGCHLDDFGNRPNFASKRILHGNNIGTAGDFVYYSIDGEDGAAVGLSETGKAKTTINLSSAGTYEGKTVTGIWHDAFYGSNATTVVISDTITTIDCEAFLGSKINSIVIPDNVERIGEGAFYGCRDLTRVQFGNSGGEGGADDCDCDTSGEASTPQLTKIPAFCFFQCQALVDLFLPSTITEIGEEAFNGCKSITTNLYLQSIKTIRSRAFQGCSSLTNLYIASSMFDSDNISATGIQPRAFLYCSSALNVTFFGDSDDIGDSSTEDTWVYNHPNWGVYNDAGNAYTPTIIDGSVYSTALWDFTVDVNNEVTLTHYNGATPTNFLSIPNTMSLAPAGNKVTRIATDAFEGPVKTALKRLYLPTTLKAIENSMFDSSYTNLTVVASNKQCAGDSASVTDFTENGKIDLHDLTNLEFIGDYAFVNMAKRGKVKKIHLPSRLIAVGSYVFANSGGNRFSAVTEFQWDYVDPDIAGEATGSRLEVVGKQSFFLLGEDKGSVNDGYSSDARYSNARTLSTLVFPRTFKHFGMTTNDKTRYENDYGFTFSINLTTDANKRPDLIFSGCPLIKKVIFKGSSDSSKTSDLVLVAQTFNCCHNLQTIIFEERQNKTISFINQQDNWSGQQTIGAAGTNNCGEVDFRSTPMLQTIILPCVNTNIRLQEYALGGNARAALYLSGAFDSHFKANKQTDKNAITLIDNGFTDQGNFNLNYWDAIGTEASNGKKRGYDLYTNGGDYNGKNTFNIVQKLAKYPNIHYKETFKDAANNDVTVEVGSGNTQELVLDSSSKCSFVCDKSTNKATMSNYLYDCHVGVSGTATVPASYTIADGSNAGTYAVNKIGANAFSACYCDNKDNGLTTGTDLTTVILPNSITEIGEYAFARAYNVKNISTSADAGSKYIMPTSLTLIGKHAFIFSGIEQIRKIPNTCVFFENTSSNTANKNTSVFSNCLDLRRVTFLNGSGTEGNESAYYLATTYTSTTSGTPIYTSAIYAKKDTSGNFKKYVNRLLIVLNRKLADKDVESPDYTTLNSDSYKTFDMTYKPSGTATNAHLYGAMKMGYWIRKVKLNKVADNPEALFSAVCNRASSSSEMSAKPIYLTKAVYANNTNAIACDLEEITGSVFNAPQYAFAGCEKLHIVELENKTNGALPDGVFANVNNTNIKYKTSADSTLGNGILNLTGTGYTSIGSETFRNNQAIEKFIAAGPDFTINANAFRDCDNLTEIDLRNVTGTLTLKADCFAYCDNLQTIRWPASCTSIVIEKEAFRECGTNTVAGSGTSTLTFPAVSNLSISEDCFRNSPYIQTLDFSAVTGTLTLNNRCFADCESLEEIIWPGSSTEVDLFHEGMFAHCLDLVEVALPQNVKANDAGHRCVGAIADGTGVQSGYGNDDKFYRGVFQACLNLEKVYVDPDPDDATPLTSNITDFTAYTFRLDHVLTEFVFADFPSVTTLHRDFLGGGYSPEEWNSGYAGAYGTDGTTELVLPSSLETLGKSCFSGCGVRSIEFTSLTLDTNTGGSIDKPYFNGDSKNKAANENHFRFSRNLVSVKFHPNCTLGENFYKSSNSFNGCSALETLLLPANFYNRKPNMPKPDNKGSGWLWGATNVNILIQGKRKGLDSTQEANLSGDNGSWRKTDANTTKPINWQIDTTPATALTDVLNGGGALTDNETHYWAYINGEPTVLGTANTYEDGVLTFSSGWRLSSTNGFVSPS